MERIHNRLYLRALALICSFLLARGEPFLFAQSPPQTPPATQQQTQTLNSEQLDSLVAPIALYPDQLLAQVLAATTYPLEVVTAHRWVKQHSTLKGKALVDAAGKEDWDPSIQALVAFPDVLQLLDQNLAWATELGNAFLAQQSDVMLAVQRMRAKAEDAGKLQSTAQQQVQTSTVEGQPTITIQPADPQTVYVPTYEPEAVYGAAPAYYPYPAVSYPSGGVWAAGAISFGVGVAIGSIFNNGWGWGWGCNWGNRPSLYVNNNFFNSNRNTFVNRGRWDNAYRGNGRAGWNHNPRYRGNVPYPNRGVANRFNGGRGGMRPSQLPSNIGNIRPPGAGGRGPGSPGHGLAGRGRPGQLPSHPNAGNRPGGPGNRPGAPAHRPGGRPANAGIGNRPGGRGPSQLPSQVGGNRPGAGHRPGNVNRPGTGSASRMAPNGWNGSRMGSQHRGGGGGGARFGGGGHRGGGFGGGGRSRGGGGGRSRGGGGRRR